MVFGTDADHLRMQISIAKGELITIQNLVTMALDQSMMTDHRVNVIGIEGMNHTRKQEILLPLRGITENLKESLAELPDLLTKLEDWESIL